MEYLPYPFYTIEGHGMNQNGSGRKKDEKIMVDALDGYLAVFDHLPTLMWRSGTDAKCNYFNQSWLAFTGRSMEEEIGDGWVIGVHPEDLDRCVSTFLTAFEKHEAFEMEYRLRHHSGEYRWILDIGRPFNDAHGAFAGFIGTCFDLTEKKELENALTQANDALEASNRALRENEQMFKGLFEYAPDAVIAVDQSGTIVLMNMQVEKVFGYTREELVGQPVEMLMPGSFAERHRSHLTGYMTDPHVRPMGLALPLYGKRKDGSLFPADINLGPLHTAGGVIVMATIRDTTERKKAEEAILEREKLLITAAQAAPIVFFRIDRQGIIQFSLGQSLARRLNDVETIGKSIYEVYRGVPGVIEGFERALAGETFTTMIEAGGLIYETTYAPLENEAGEINGVVGVASDVTHHRMVEEALRESEAHFRTIFNNTTLGIFLLNSSGKMIETNLSMQESLLYSAYELRHMPFMDLIHPDDREPLQVLVNAIQQGQTEAYQTEKRFVSRDNRILWFRLSMSLFRESDGTPRFGIGMMENITAHKSVEAELAEVQRRLADSAELERLQLAQELHDGPLQDLQVMSMQLALIDSMVESGEIKPELVNLHEELSKVIRAIRFTCGELRPPSLAPFGLEKAIESHAEQFRGQYNQIKVNLKLMKDGKQLSERVRMALFRIYQQSMANIVRHSGAHNVWVSFSFDENQIALRIEDDGKGFTIPKRWVELVRQGHFGLVGSKERAESVGGTLEVHSNPGSGTVINVIVPRWEKDQIPLQERYSETVSGS
jgi:PAS domain S-box-containing protein